MSTGLLRVLTAFALLGAGLVNLGLVRGTFPSPAAVAAALVGAGELVLAIVALHDENLSARAWRCTSLALVTAAVGWVVVAAASARGLGPADASVATLQVLASCAAAAQSRSGWTASVPAEPTEHPVAAASPGPSPSMRLGVLFVGALVVSGLATAGLADTEAGTHAVPHGEHHLPALPGLHSHH